MLKIKSTNEKKKKLFSISSTSADLAADDNVIGIINLIIQIPRKINCELNANDHQRSGKNDVKRLKHRFWNVKSLKMKKYIVYKITEIYYY